MYALQKDIHETKVLGDIHQVNADFSIKGVGREYSNRKGPCNELTEIMY
jgi:hypothetical protein